MLRMRTGFARSVLLLYGCCSAVPARQEQLGSTRRGSRLRQWRARVVVTMEEGGGCCGCSEVEGERRTATQRVPGRDPRGAAPEQSRAGAGGGGCVGRRLSRRGHGAGEELRG